MPKLKILYTLNKIVSLQIIVTNIKHLKPLCTFLHICLLQAISFKAKYTFTYSAIDKLNRTYKQTVTITNLIIRNMITASKDINIFFKKKVFLTDDSVQLYKHQHIKLSCYRADLIYFKMYIFFNKINYYYC